MRGFRRVCSSGALGVAAGEMGLLLCFVEGVLKCFEDMIEVRAVCFYKWSLHVLEAGTIRHR